MDGCVFKKWYAWVRVTEKEEGLRIGWEKTLKLILERSSGASKELNSNKLIKFIMVIITTKTILNRPCLYRPPVSVALALSPLRYHPGGPMAPPNIQQRPVEQSPTASSSPKQDSHHDDQDDGKK